MTVGDVPEVMAIEVASFPLPWSARAFLYEIERNTASTMLVVRFAPRRESQSPGTPDQPGPTKEASVLGYGGFWLLVDEIHISTIAVHPHWRNRGLGELLLLSLLESGLDLGAQGVTLEVRVSNIAAQSLYRKHGFVISSRRRRYYSDSDEDAYIMTIPRFGLPDHREALSQQRQHLLWTVLSQPSRSPPLR